MVEVHFCVCSHHLVGLVAVKAVTAIKRCLSDVTRDPACRSAPMEETNFEEKQSPSYSTVALETETEKADGQVVARSN